MGHVATTDTQATPRATRAGLVFWPESMVIFVPVRSVLQVGE